MHYFIHCLYALFYSLLLFQLSIFNKAQINKPLSKTNFLTIFSMVLSNSDSSFFSSSKVRSLFSKFNLFSIVFLFQ